MYARVVVLFAVFICNAINASGIQNSKYWERNDVKVKQIYVSAEYSSRTALSCLSDCSATEGCITVFWSLEENYCLLSDIDQTNDHPHEQVPTELVVISNWKTMTKIRFPCR
jgi:hypothetical protein